MNNAIKDTREMTTSRFTRSIHLERDIWDTEVLRGYVVTATARQVISRIGIGYRAKAGSRAWTLTGPYGTGKSAFAKFVAHVLAPASCAGTAEARELLSAQDGQLVREILDPSAPRRGLWPVTVTGTREPLHLALLRALHSSLAAYDHAGTSSTKCQVARCLHHAQKGEIIGTSEITELFATALEAISHGSSSASGLFLIIDELGKLLEYAAAHPGGSDLYILQSLAEFAARSSKPFVIVGILHQDFAVYTDRLSARERAEWDKVRGRFEDLVFVEPADEILRLIAKARSIARNSQDDVSLGSRATRVDRGAFAKLTEAAWKLDFAPAGMTKGEFLELLRQCFPLHPTVAVLLGRLFRKLAQNERSVFSFLESSEPLALRDFLRSARGPGSVYRLDTLYDYLLASLGEGLYVHSQGKRWAEIETILGRLSDASPLEAFLVKTIGMLGAIGAAGNAGPSRDVLAFAAMGMASQQQVDDALSTLQRRSAIVLRRYNNTFSLWEGSDIDLDERVRAAAGRVEGEQDIAALASRFLKPRPLVARRHSFQTGALRYFQVCVVAPGQLRSIPEQMPAGADGTLVIVLPQAADEAEEARQVAETSPLRERRDLLIVMPADVRALGDSIRECACLEWVRANTPELEGDATARRELRARLTAMRRRMEAAFAAILDPAKVEFGSGVWLYKGRERRLRSQRDVNELLSRICDKVYTETPRLHNELINRRELSSAAAAARRNLIEAMIERGDTPSLGISGTPPEMSMYLSLLVASGIHRRTPLGWRFGVPKADSTTSLRPAWNAILEYVSGDQDTPRPLSHLFDMLQMPPYGMKAGPLPVLLCAILSTYEAEIALYEDGSFVPQLTVAVFERLMRAPERFTLQRWRITGVRAKVFQGLAKMLGSQVSDVGLLGKQILDVVRPLCRFAAQLNDYTRNTQRLSAKAKAIREALMRARQPDVLLFVDLPNACDTSPFAARGADLSQIDPFITRLREGLRELQHCYPDLLDDIAKAICAAFGFDGDIGESRRLLARRAVALKSWSADALLKSFCVRAADSELKETPWLESVSALIAQKPPSVWRDEDRERFDQGLVRIARLFVHAEALAYGNEDGLATVDAAVEEFRIGITSRQLPELERVIRVPSRFAADVDRLESAVEEAIRQAGINGHVDIAMAALARLARRMLAHTSDDHR